MRSLHFIGWSIAFSFVLMPCLFHFDLVHFIAFIFGCICLLSTHQDTAGKRLTQVPFRSTVQFDHCVLIIVTLLLIFVHFCTWLFILLLFTFVHFWLFIQWACSLCKRVYFPLIPRSTNPFGSFLFIQFIPLFGADHQIEQTTDINSSTHSFGRIRSIHTHSYAS